MAETMVRRVAGRGRFISIEGSEGAGTSTQLKMLAERLDGANLRTIVTREPGGSPGADIIRHVLSSGIGGLLGPEAETLLLAVAREDHVRSVIEPALNQGIWVLCSGFSDATRAYHGSLGKVAPGVLNAMERVTIGDVRPDFTIILDVPPEVGLRRARGVTSPDLEAEAIERHQQVREAFRQIAAAEPQRCRMIDASADPATVATQIWVALRDRFFAAGAGNVAHSA